MEKMTDSLKVIAGDRMKNLLARMTSNRFKGALTGAAIARGARSRAGGPRDLPAVRRLRRRAARRHPDRVRPMAPRGRARRRPIRRRRHRRRRNLQGGALRERYEGLKGSDQLCSQVIINRGRAKLGHDHPLEVVGRELRGMMPFIDSVSIKPGD